MDTQFTALTAGNLTASNCIFVLLGTTHI